MEVRTMEMEHKREDGVLTIVLPERIDPTNASDAEAEIERILSEGEGEVIVFDASNMNYISSAGLRVIIKVVKQGRNVTVKDVSSDVYDIFKVSGFTNFINVEKRTA